MARQCFICGFELQRGISSQRGPYLFRIPTSIRESVLFVCSIHFGKECLKALNNVWYLRKDSIPTQYLEPYFDLEKIGMLPVNKLGNAESKIKNKMNKNEEKENINSHELPTFLSSPVFDVDPDMPKLSLNLNDWGSPQNLTSRIRKLKLNVSTQIWSYESASSSEDESSNSSPPPLLRFDEDDKETASPCLSSKNQGAPEDLTLLAPEVTSPEETNGWKEKIPVPNIHSTVVPPISRCSTGNNFQLHKSFWHKNWRRGYCPFASEFPLRHIRKTKSKKSSLCEKYSDIRIPECTTLLRQVDEIDGFMISSFATSEDLDEFCTQQFVMHANVKATLNSHVEVSDICSARRCTSSPERLHFALEEEALILTKTGCSVRTNTQLRNPTPRIPRHHRYSTSASSSPCLGMPQTKNTKSTKSLCCEKLVEVFPSSECENLCQIDDIDGFRISSFSCSEDLDKFCTQQFLMNKNLNTIPDCLLDGTETEKHRCSFVPAIYSSPRTAKTRTGKDAAIPASLLLTVPHERSSIIMPNPSTSSSSCQRRTVNPNVEVQPRSTIIRQKPVYNLKHFPTNRRYTEKRCIFMRLKKKIKELENQLAEAHKVADHAAL